MYSGLSIIRTPKEQEKMFMGILLVRIMGIVRIRVGIVRIMDICSSNYGEENSNRNLFPLYHSSYLKKCSNVILSKFICSKSTIIGTLSQKF